MRTIVFLLSVLLLTSCASGNGQNIVHLVGPSIDVSVVVEIADEPDERAVGLMWRNELPEGHGMLFVFDEPQELSFWMKNTYIPLEILFFDEDKKFVDVKYMTPCEEDPCQGYRSNEPATYALEVNAGFVVQHIPRLPGQTEEPLRLQFLEDRGE